MVAVAVGYNYELKIQPFFFYIAFHGIGVGAWIYKTGLSGIGATR